MTPKPTNVVSHFLVFRGTFGAVLASVNKDAAQILLMVKPEKGKNVKKFVKFRNFHTVSDNKPGIITEAKACQTKVSKAATPTLVIAPSVFPNCFLAFEDLSNVSAKTYADATPYDA